MKLTIATSGGIGNIRLHGELDTDALDPGLARKAETLLRAERLDSLRPDAAGPVADATQFEIGIVLEDGVHRYTVDEAQAPPELVELLQALVHEIVLRKRRP